MNKLYSIRSKETGEHLRASESAKCKDDDVAKEIIPTTVSEIYKQNKQ